MLMPTTAQSYAHRLLDARAHCTDLAPLSAEAAIDIADAYAIAQCLDGLRTSSGETPIGRKLGFTNFKLWPKYGQHEAIHEPFWTTLFDSTVRFLEYPYTFQSLAGANRPRIEPEVVFKLGKTPAADASIDELADCLEWMAHAIEIDVCPFPDWKFEAADAIAAFGLHGTLLIGEPRLLSSASRHHLTQVLASSSVSIACDGSLVGAGFGNNILESPLHAIWHLHQLLKTQPQFPALRAGEIITTGSWTDAYPVKAGQTWVTAFSGAQLPGLTVTFV